MKWLIWARRFVNSQRYHLREGSCSRYLCASNLTGRSISCQTQSSSLFSGHYYSTSTIQNATDQSVDRLVIGNNHENNVNKVDLEIISKETIKPTTPTPSHQRTFNLSIIDQYMYDVYIPLILFLPNTDNASVMDVVTKRSKHLKETLSDVLTRFYPLAGKVKDNLHIECNDEGVYYTEARVNQTLHDFLRDPYDEKVRELTPEKPRTTESSIGNFILGIQVNIFNCGGIGLGTSVSHKIFDGHTYFMFMKAWAAAARGSPDKISPSFVASELFPNNPSLEYSVSSKLTFTKRLSTKRFVFDSTALALLKAQPVASARSAKPATRMEATSAIIWKAAATAASTVRPFTPESPHALLSFVNFRKRASPPLPKNSIGNLVDIVGAMCFPGRQLNLPTLMGEVKESIAKINTNHVESMKGVKGHEKFNEILKELNYQTDVTQVGDYMFASSLLNSGIYEFDFGWGKPIWFYLNSGISKVLYLNDTLKGGGVEAILTMSPEEMEIVECDPDLLSYATVNPSPLRFLN